MDDQRGRTIKTLFLTTESKEKDVTRIKELQRWFPEQTLAIHFIPERWDEYKLVCLPSYFEHTAFGKEWLKKAEAKHIFVAII